MPRPTEWLQQVPAALEGLEQLETPVVDRALLERVLCIHRRTAIRLMHRLGGIQVGRTFLIRRTVVLRELRKIAAGEPYCTDVGRRERLGTLIDKTRQDMAARRITIPAAPDVAYREFAGLPSTIRLAPGKLEIACANAQDLLRQLMELAQAIANEFDRFEAIVGKQK